MSIVLFISVFLIAACGLIYELIADTLASYLLGDSVFQFSTIIGGYLFAMGIGSFLSRFLSRSLCGLHLESDYRGGRLILQLTDSVATIVSHPDVGPVKRHS